LTLATRFAYAREKPGVRQLGDGAHIYEFFFTFDGDTPVAVAVRPVS